jgi:hypothetical protein
MISGNTRSKDLRVDYPQQSTRSSGATPIGCTFGAPNEFRSPAVQNADLRSKSLRQNTKFRVIKAEEGSEKLFLPSHSEFRSVSPASLSPKRFLLKSKDWKLDLGSLGRLFQNRPKDRGLVGDRYPPGPPEG